MSMPGSQPACRAARVAPIRDGDIIVKLSHILDLRVFGAQSPSWSKVAEGGNIAAAKRSNRMVSSHTALDHGKMEGHSPTFS